MSSKILLTFLITFTHLILFACEDDDPQTTPIAGEMNAGEMNAEMCTPVESDYPSDSWEMCISDQGRYELAGASTPSSAARVAAYEAIGDLLWRNPDMTAEDFIQAELIYGEDGGVGSRVTRRYDAHISKPDGADCASEDADELWPEYCVGPSMIEPMILSSFAEGNTGMNMIENAAKIKAGLLWFFYVSTYKEAYTCAGKAADCDSHWAYCNGAKQLDEIPFGLGAEIQSVSETAYEHLFNAHLAVRCWRDLDSAEVAENDVLHSQVLDQLDRALDYGYALMMSSLLRQTATSEDNLAQITALQVLLPTLTRAMQVKLPELDQTDWAQNLSSLSTADSNILNAIADQIDIAFACP